MSRSCDTIARRGWPSRLVAAVSKTAVPRGTGGSNPPRCAIDFTVTYAESADPMRSPSRDGFLDSLDVTPVNDPKVETCPRAPGAAELQRSDVPARRRDAGAKRVTRS